MVAKVSDDIFTHPPYDPQIWLEALISDEPDRNQVYDLPTTLAWELRADRTISTTGTPHFSPSYKSQDFDEIVQKSIHEQLLLRWRVWEQKYYNKIRYIGLN